MCWRRSLSCARVRQRPSLRSARKGKPQMPARIKVGVIGLGRMGNVHARLLATQIAGASLYAVAESDEQARTRAAAEMSIERIFADPFDLLALPELEAVIVTRSEEHTSELQSRENL